jgi:hypothetical protein
MQQSRSLEKSATTTKKLPITFPQQRGTGVAKWLKKFILADKK